MEDCPYANFCPVILSLCPEANSYKIVAIALLILLLFYSLYQLLQYMVLIYCTVKEKYCIPFGNLYTILYLVLKVSFNIYLYTLLSTSVMIEYIYLPIFSCYKGFFFYYIVE